MDNLNGHLYRPYLSWELLWINGNVELGYILYLFCEWDEERHMVSSAYVDIIHNKWILLDIKTLIKELRNELIDPCFFTWHLHRLKRILTTIKTGWLKYFCLKCNVSPIVSTNKSSLFILAYVQRIFSKHLCWV